MQNNTRLVILENKIKQLTDQINNIKLPPMMAGAPGSRILSGAGLPGSGAGKPNDLYLDSNTGKYYIKTGRGWNTNTPNGHLYIQNWVENNDNNNQATFNPNPNAFPPLNTPGFVPSALTPRATQNVDVTVEPLGTGSFRDSSTGATRGTNAVDLQINRENDNQVASGNYSSISGGANNTASGAYSNVSGGYNNTASGDYSDVSGGANNTASGCHSNIGGGSHNTARGNISFVGNGDCNRANGWGSFIGGGRQNKTCGIGAVVVGGGNVDDDYDGNTADGDYSIIGAGQSNSTNGYAAGVFAGDNNDACGDCSFIGGGESNTASGYGSAVIGGSENTAYGCVSLAHGGAASAEGNFSTAIGLCTTAPNDHSFACGAFNDPSQVSSCASLQFMVGGGWYGYGNLFSVDNHGNIYFPGTIYNGGCDYAEFFESSDTTKYPVGTSVAFTGADRKIRVAAGSDVPFGVVSKKPNMTGNSAETHWTKKYITAHVPADKYEKVYETKTVKRHHDAYINGQIVRTSVDTEIKVPVLEEVEMVENGKVFAKAKIPKKVKTGTYNKRVVTINPAFNPHVPYVPRSERPEWNIVAMMGIVDVLKTSIKHPNWTLVQSPSVNSPDYDTYHIH